MALVEHYFDIPELGNNNTVGCTDWRPGSRIAVLHHGFTSFSAAVVLVVALVMIIVLLGSVLGAIIGDFAHTFNITFKIAIGAGIVFALLFVCLDFYLPERENVIDWQAGSIRFRTGHRWRTYALSDLLEISIVEDRLNEKLTTASVQLLVSGEQLQLLNSKSCEAFGEACGLVVTVGERLAEACGVPFELPQQINRNQLPTIPERELAKGYVQAGSYCTRQMQSAEEDEDGKRRERFRNEAFDYFSLANQCDPTFATPLLELAKLFPDDSHRMQAIEQALAADASSSQALVDRAKLREKMGQYDLAEADYDAAIEIERDVTNLKSRSDFRFRRNRFRASIEDLSEAIVLNGTNDLLPILLDARACGYHACYEADKSKVDLRLAIADWRLAVELDPEVRVSLDCILEEREENGDPI